ncbi:MAG: mannose-1-phosphate guanylyltransferase [Candidatus Thorarchaeota archaeon]
MEKENFLAVVMAGGKGERFWPRSRINKPKQTLAIGTNDPLLMETVKRLSGLISESHIFISTNNSLVEPFKQLLANYKTEFILEPLARDTAAAIGYCCLFLSNKFDLDHVIAFIGSDYLITNKSSFQLHLQAAYELAFKEDVIVTLGIKPVRPATGYGYIQLGEGLPDPIKGIKANKVKGFREKPNFDVALEYLDSGQFLWNSGMFVTKIGVMLKEIEKYLSKHYTGLKRIAESNFDSKVILEEFSKIDKISIDFAVMEKTSNIAVITGNFDWDDMGDWEAYSRVSKKDGNANVIHGEWLGINTQDSIIYNESDKLISTIGIKDLYIIVTEDSILICNKNESQNVKKLVQKLNSDEKYKKYM